MNFRSFLESYLKSGRQPIYHITDTVSLISIINDNLLKVSSHKNILNNKPINMVSFTRNPKLDLSYYKDCLDVIIEIDFDKLSKKYKIIPYDFFVNSGKENLPKSNLRRTSEFEFEEIIIGDVENIMDYIISIDFRNDSIYNMGISDILTTIKSNGIKIKVDGN